MLRLLYLCVAALPSISVTARHRDTALKQETILVPFEDGVRDTLGFGRYSLRPHDHDHDLQHSHTLPAQRPKDEEERRHHRPLARWFYHLPAWRHEETSTKTGRQEEISHGKTTNWLQLPPPNFNGRNKSWDKWQRRQNQELNPNEEKAENKTGMAHKHQPDNSPHCFGCDREETTATKKRFLFRKVDVDTSYDPFTKKPYHRTILAIRALPDTIRPKPSPSVAVESDRSPVSRVPNRPNHDDDDAESPPYKYPPPEDDSSSSSDYDADEGSFKRTSMDSLWISSYLENPSKFDSISKQLRFLKRWLARLDRYRRRRVQTNQSH